MCSFCSENRLQDFCVGGAGGGLNSSEGGAKKLIQLRESYERLTYAISFFYKQQLRKRHISLFPVVLNFSYATVISHLSSNAKYDTYKVISFLNEYRKDRIFFFTYIHISSIFFLTIKCQSLNANC